MKPKVFIGSSTEGLNIAYAIQSNLEHTAEVTVWDQGIFEPSKYTLEGILEMLDSTDFGIFVFTPDDVVRLREQEFSAVRDNVLFELGLFIGRLGRERSFVVCPRELKDFRLPSDLLGLTMLQFNPNRKDGNLRAALGPATNEMRKVLSQLGAVQIEKEQDEKSQAEQLNSEDILSILQSWMGSRDARLNTQVIKYTDVDKELNLPKGSAKKYIEKAAQHWEYVLERKGDSTILFKDAPNKYVIPVRKNKWDAF